VLRRKGTPARTIHSLIYSVIEATEEEVEKAEETFRNTVLGEVWQEHGEAPDWERLVERREDFPLGTVPAGVLVLTAGVDVQDDRIEVDVWGWAEGYTSWLIDHVVMGRRDGSGIAAPGADGHPRMKE
jgi:phage terminase large subunit GpA-like protein